MDTLKELVQFMQPGQRLDLKAVALTHVLSLTGSGGGKAALLQSEELMAALFSLTQDQTHSIAKDAVLSLINLTADEAGAIKIHSTATVVEPTFFIVAQAVKGIIDAESELADPWSMVLSNLTRVESLVHAILTELGKNEKTLLDLAKAFTNLEYNRKKAKLHYLGPIFCNLTQIPDGRELFCRSKYHLLDKVLPFASYPESVVRRGGTIGILKNLCCDPVYHDEMLLEDNDSDDILCAILYPLCGSEEYTDEEYDKFPIALQFLPEIKERETDPDLRKMLLDCLMQLCATRRSRELLRAKGVYEILREYHKWEGRQGRDSECMLACENVVDILIKKEDEIGLDNYKAVEVPSSVAEKFVKEDAEYLKDLIPSKPETAKTHD